ncbi:MAG: hypothetical protein H8F28_07750 [Fibrella sp.]|nr:hypothetical protein [Armatimonadota bacterium]
MKRNFITVSLALTALTIVSSTTVNAQNLTINPGFESGINSWTLSGSGRSDTYAFYRDMTPTPPAFGSQLFAFNTGDGTPNAVLSQSFATTPGAAYSVSFVFGNYSTSQPSTQSITADVLNTADGAVLNSVIATDSVPGRQSTFDAVMDTTNIFSFTATGVNSTLRFADSPISSTESTDGILDNVSVVAVVVPEAGSLVLVLSALALVGAIATVRLRCENHLRPTPRIPR